MTDQVSAGEVPAGEVPAGEVPVAIGQPAPDFSLRNQYGESVELSSYRGDLAVFLVFYPFTFTPVCQDELMTLSQAAPKLTEGGVRILAISCDSVFAQQEWAATRDFVFPLLSDHWPHGEAARSYGVFHEALGCAYRATFLINREGLVADRFVSDGLRVPRQPARYLEALKRLAPPPG